MKPFPAAWQELHVWLLHERKEALQKAKQEPDHLGFLGELLTLRKMIKKVNRIKADLRAQPK